MVVVITEIADLGSSASRLAAAPKISTVFS